MARGSPGQLPAGPSHARGALAAHQQAAALAARPRAPAAQPETSHTRPFCSCCIPTEPWPGAQQGPARRAGGQPQDQCARAPFTSPGSLVVRHDARPWCEGSWVQCRRLPRWMEPHPQQPWPSGLRRCVASAVGIMSPRAFKSHRLRQEAHFCGPGHPPALHQTAQTRADCQLPGPRRSGLGTGR